MEIMYLCEQKTGFADGLSFLYIECSSLRINLSLLKDLSRKLCFAIAMLVNTTSSLFFACFLICWDGSATLMNF